MKTTLYTAALGLGLALTTGCGDDVVAESCDPEVIGTICTTIGLGENGYDRGADMTAIPALEARLSLPQDVLPAPDGSVYVLDWNNHRLRRLGTDGSVHWVAGRGELGGTLDDPGSGDLAIRRTSSSTRRREHPHRRLAQQQGPLDRLATGVVTATAVGAASERVVRYLRRICRRASRSFCRRLVIRTANQVLRRVDGRHHPLARGPLRDRRTRTGRSGPCATGVDRCSALPGR